MQGTSTAVVTEAVSESDSDLSGSDGDAELDDELTDDSALNVSDGPQN